MRSTEATEDDRAISNGVDQGNVPGGLDYSIVADVGGTRLVDDEGDRFRQAGRWWGRWRRWVVIGLVVVAILWVGITYGVPYLRELLETVQTNDAFVSGHISYVSPRIEDVVTEVLVDQDDRVEPGQLLVRLDRQPFELTVAQDEAAVDQARANLVQARAQVGSLIAQARAAYYQRKNAQEIVRQQ